MAAPGRLLLRPRPGGLLLLLPGLLLPLADAFNLDVESPAEYAGPEGSYFGFAVDFFEPSTSSMFLLVGAPKANTTQPGIVEGGQVLKCECSSSRRCQPIEFDSTAHLQALQTVQREIWKPLAEAYRDRLDQPVIPHPFRIGDSVWVRRHQTKNLEPR